MTDPRFRLANERTFLAWSRTALALVAAGLAVTELLAGNGTGTLRRLLGVPLILAGGTIAFLALRRRDAVERALAAGDELPDTALPVVLTTVVVAATFAAVALALLR